MQNLVILAGNVGATPEARTTQGGTRINQFRIPHVTHHDDADVTGLDEVRARSATGDVRITPLAYMEVGT